MIATLPSVNLDASNLTVRLGDRRLPPLSDFPAWMALTKHLDMLLGPIEVGN